MSISIPISAAPDITITILRSLVLIFWSLVAMWSWPSFRLTIVGSGESGDHKEAALVITGISVIGFQVRALMGQPALAPDNWTAAFLAILACAPVAICWLVYLPRTPKGHKRAAVLTFLSITVACIVGGSLG